MKDLEQKNISDYSMEYWSRFKDDLSEEDRERVENVVKSIPPNSTSVLEIGCGSGEIINRIEIESRMGLDIDACVLSNVNCDTTVASASKIPFQDRSWDVVIASEVLEHIQPEDYKNTLREINRVAGRYIIISVPNHEVLSSNLTRCKNCGAIYHRNFHFRAYNIHSIANPFKDFQLQYSQEIGGFIRSRTRIENMVRHRIMNSWAPLRNTICPECGTNYFDGTPQVFASSYKPNSKGGIGRFVADIISRKRAIWIIAVYKRYNST